MGAHQATADHVVITEHQLNLRLLRFRNRPEHEEPALLALELAAAGRTHDAIEVVDDALARDPDDMDVLLGCGIAAIRSGQLAFAQMILTRAATHDPSWSEALGQLAKVLRMRGRHDKAVEVARRAIDAGDRDPQIATMVREDDRRRQLDARVASWRNDPEREEPALLAQALLSAERARDAIDLLHAALGREDDVDLRMIEARAQLSIGDRTAAMDALQLARRSAPDWREPARMLAELLVEDRREDEARAIALPFEGLAEALGIPRKGGDAALDELLGTLDRIDPIGDDTRRGFARSDTLVDTLSPVGSETPTRPRSGWLPQIAKTLFGAPRVIDARPARARSAQA